MAIKLLLTIYCCTLYVLSFAQNKENAHIKHSVNSKANPIPIDAKLDLDSLTNKREIMFRQLDETSKNDTSIHNLIVKQKSKIGYNMPIKEMSDRGLAPMPIKKLSGKGLAPMPGTDSLDRQKNASDSISPPKIIIKTTFPNQ